MFIHHATSPSRIYRKLIARMASPEVALAVLEALEEGRAPLDGYIHGDNEITVPTLHNMLNAVDRALRLLNGQAQPTPAPHD